MQPQHQEPSPIGYSHDAIVQADDEANLFQVEEVVSIEATTVQDIESREELEALLNTPIMEANDEGDAVAEEQSSDVLEALLAEAVADMEAGATLRKLRSQASKSGLSAREREEIAAKIREWEARVEWQDEANVALFTRQLCLRCGAVQFPFNSMLRRQSHKTVNGSMRWIKADTMDLRLPRETVLKDRSTPFCQACSDSHGWYIHTAQVLIQDEV